jgi:transcriptional regulator with XRE-family HTH domain
LSGGLSVEDESKQSASVAPTLGANNLGVKLRQLRETQGISQRELARRAGVTNANLSMIEQGKVSPSVNTLELILAPLKFSLAEFFQHSLQAESAIIKKEDLAWLQTEACEYWILNPQQQADTPTLVKQILYPGAKISGIWLKKYVWLSGFVVQGELLLELDGQPSVLREGDGFHFHIRRPHQFVNTTTDTTILMLAFNFR